MTNPFIFGNPVRGVDFFGRRRELRRLAGHVCKGNSALISAEPRFGKTSLLLRMQDPSLYGEAAAHLHFCYLDAHALTGWDVSRFWKESLTPVRVLSPAIKTAYASAKSEHFGTFVLERVFLRLEEAGERLILLLDEFDAILNIPGLHTIEFYGGLRSLATRFVSLSLVIAARRSVAELNRRTQEFSRLSSPYLNAVEEIPLGPFLIKDVATLLSCVNEQFDREDRIFLQRITGGHPYFLQAAASYLWDAYEDGKSDPVARRVWAGEQCFNQARSILKNTWDIWSPYQQIAFTLAALDVMPYLVEGREFDVVSLSKDLPNFAQERRELSNRGFLKSAQLDGGYAPQAEIMLWFLAEELTALLRPQAPDVAAWLHKQEWDGSLKSGEKETLLKAVRALGPFLKDGALAFIKGAAEGFGKGLTGKP